LLILLNIGGLQDTNVEKWMWVYLFVDTIIAIALFVGYSVILSNEAFYGSPLC
jgi:hypothetical protein